MSCPQCLAANNRNTGVYMTGCTSCDGRHLTGLMPAAKKAMWEKAQAGDKHAIEVCEQAKRWVEIFKNGSKK